MNSGRTPIVESQFVAPIVLAISQGQILDVRLNRTDPAGVAVQTFLGPDKTYLRFSVPLLNPADAVYLTLLVSSASPRLIVTGRIAGVREVSLKDRRQPLVTRPAPRLSWSFYVVGAVTVLILSFLILVLYMKGGESALEKATRAGLIHIPRGQSAGALSETITNALKEFAAPEVQPTLKLLGEEQRDAMLSDAKTLEIEAALREGLSKMTGLWSAVIVLAVLLVIGSWYLLSRLF